MILFYLIPDIFEAGNINDHKRSNLKIWKSNIF